MSETIAVSHATKGWVTRLVVFALARDWSARAQDQCVTWVMTGERPEPTPQDAP